ncbi:hypothetical protein KJ966_31820 [bacterium]|nr:hypothetical protein [bacterium]
MDEEDIRASRGGLEGADTTVDEADPAAGDAEPRQEPLVYQMPDDNEAAVLIDHLLERQVIPPLPWPKLHCIGAAFPRVKISEYAGEPFVDGVCVPIPGAENKEDEDG